MEAPKQGVNRNRQSRATAEGAHADLGGKKKVRFTQKYVAVA